MMKLSLFFRVSEDDENLALQSCNAAFLGPKPSQQASWTGSSHWLKSPGEGTRTGRPKQPLPSIQQKGVQGYSSSGKMRDEVVEPHTVRK